MEIVQRHSAARQVCQDVLHKASTSLTKVPIVWDDQHPLQVAMRSVRMQDTIPKNRIRLDTPITTIRVDGKTLPLNSNLMNLGNQAHFGEGTETKMDLSVRNAYEITADRLCVNEWKDYLEYIAEDLAEFLNLQPFMIIPYKLQMYGVNGHFKEHTDTLHHANHVATLLIRLPTTYTGGELMLTGNPWEHYGDSYLHWIAFFTDTPHEVKPVKSGFRAMLQFEIYLDNPQDLTLPRDRAWYLQGATEHSEHTYEEEDPVHNKMRDLLGRCEESTPIKVFSPRAFQVQAIMLAVADELKNGHIPCFLLQHMYPADGLQKALFKGADQTLKLMFEGMGYRVIGIPATLKGEWNYQGDIYEDSVSLCAWNVNVPLEAKTPCAWRLFYDTGQCSYMYTLQKTEAIAHTGNEAAPGNLVALTGIMVVFPYGHEASTAKRVCVRSS